jgi:glycosyltransferase involved in cell wall biosynthesis
LNGYLFDPEDSSALENYIVRYIHTPEVRKMHGNRGRRDAEKLFPVETMVQNYEKAWRGAVKTGKYPS